MYECPCQTRNSRGFSYRAQAEQSLLISMLYRCSGYMMHFFPSAPSGGGSMANPSLPFWHARVEFLGMTSIVEVRIGSHEH